MNEAVKEVFVSMNKGEPRTAKCIMSFLASLCVSGGLDVCDETLGFGPAVLQPIVDRVATGASQFEKDQCALLLVSILPICAKPLSKGAWDFEAAMSIIEQHMSSRLSLFSANQSTLCGMMSAVDEEEDSLKVLDNLETMWNEVVEMRGNDFSADLASCQCFVWPDLSEELGEAIATQVQVPSEAVTLVWESAQPSLIYPSVSLFDSKCGEFGKALSALPSLSRVLLKDLSVDLLYAFEPIVQWNGLVQGTLETAGQQLLSLAHVVPGIRADFLVVETVISLAIIPASYLNESSSGRGADLLSGGHSCYFGLMLLELCKIDVKSCEPCAIAFDVLWQQLDSLEDTCSLRAAELLAHHLNNTKFRWPFWQRWTDSVDFDDDKSVECRFLRHVFQVTVNLNHSTERFKLLISEIGAELPDQLLALLPPRFSPFLGGDDHDDKYRRVAADICQRLSSQVDGAEKRRLLSAEGLMGPPAESANELAQYIASTKVILLCLKIMIIIFTKLR